LGELCLPNSPPVALPERVYYGKFLLFSLSSCPAYLPFPTGVRFFFSNIRLRRLLIFSLCLGAFSLSLSRNCLPKWHCFLWPRSARDLARPQTACLPSLFLSLRTTLPLAPLYGGVSAPVGPGHFVPNRAPSLPLARSFIFRVCFYPRMKSLSELKPWCFASFNLFWTTRFRLQLGSRATESPSHNAPVPWDTPSVCNCHGASYHDAEFFCLTAPPSILILY